MNLSRLFGAVSVCISILFTSISNASLVPVLGGQALYDTDLDVTWVADPKITNTISFGGVSLSTTVTYSDALSYIAGMNTAGYLGFGDWRLPVAPGCTFTSNCAASELGHLYWDEFSGTGAPINFSSDPDMSLLINNSIGTSTAYWTSTGSLGWRTTFAFGTGYHPSEPETGQKHLWILRNGGSEFTAPVPIPQAVWLFASGLLGLVGAVKRNGR